ncbi:hypothetical protein CEE37_00790 [candidate division LCP-89 bacterium B3_LCP]|uniref:CobQ/CobB/MinD/ParA nucleotide binding domain-containing protein n=1 Tax=candidate division LCP-89 bacterium B3_LCP TaxID=2012998 RepID=A0A532V4V5_UNCL8|nr:MAG: hypothetical protein CEE37_00790 [candidate division LCP-89 bacterium B3_LCP]
MINDQAARLRDISRLKRATEEHLRPVRRIAITSGKGGVGKSNISINLGICFQRLKRRVLLVDADTNLANIDILLGLSPKYTLGDAVIGGQFLTDILLSGPEGLKILPASSGITELVGLDEVVADRLDNAMAQLESGQDAVILDTGAGISPTVVQFASGADEVIVVTTPEPTAITDAYATIKVISSRNPALKFHLLVNFAKNRQQAEEVARKIQLVVENYLTVKINTLGFIPFDAHVPQAVARQKPFVLTNPHCPASLNINLIARKLLRLPVEKKNGGSVFRHLFKTKELA